MGIEFSAIKKEGLSVQIADAIRSAILEGRLASDERLPSENDLAERFDVSRSTVREALKRLAAQNLIRSERGSAGGAFVNHLTWTDAQDSVVTTTRLLMSMNNIALEEAIEARYALEAAILPLAAENRSREHLVALVREIEIQRDRATDDETFCASDVAFHSTVAEASGNALLAFQLSSAFEAMQPLMNMLVYRLRDREKITEFHQSLAYALTKSDSASALKHLAGLESYTKELAAKRRAPK